MMIAICVGTWAGGGLIVADAGMASAWLGAALMLYAASGLLKLRVYCRSLPSPGSHP